MRIGEAHGSFRTGRGAHRGVDGRSRVAGELPGQGRAYPAVTASSGKSMIG